MNTIAKGFTALLGAVGLGLSGYLTQMHYSAHDPNFASICDINATFDCTTVNSSVYSEFMGIPIAVFGMGFYAAVILLSLASFQSSEKFKRVQPLIWGLSCLSVFLSAILGVISATAIGAFCLFCIGLYVVNLALLGSSWSAAGLSFSPIIQELDIELRSFYKSPAIYMAGAVFVGTVLLSPGLFASDHVGAQVTSTEVTSEEDKKNINEQLKGLFETAEPVAVQLTGQEPIKGNPQAKVEIIEFADFQCPFCSVAAKSLNNMMKTYGDRVKIVYKHYPLDNQCNPNAGPLHKYACAASRASICADQQGYFWEFHQTLFDNQEHLEDADLQQYAADIGLDLAAFNTCREAPDTYSLLQADLRAGDTAKLSGTPSLFINGRRMPTQLIVQPKLLEMMLDVLLEESIEAPQSAPN